MSQRGSPAWYYPNEVNRTIRAAMESDDVTVDRLEKFLQSQLHVPRDRIQKLIEVTRSRIEAEEATPTLSLEEPRSLQSRFVGVKDIGYLGRRDFARVLGIALSSYDGNVRLPETDSPAIDLFWNRQHRTIALRTVSRPESEPVNGDLIADVDAGDTSPATGRAPSVHCVVTNAGFTPKARGVAEQRNIELFGENWLEQRFREVQLPWDIVGPLIEEAEDREDPLQELKEELSPLPDPVREIDPLSTEPVEREIAILDAPSETGSDEKTGTVTGDDNEPGQQGVLYADPEEDGDFGAFDRIADSLGDDER